jgi:tetratricopeptide (TPR) repeat protein
MSVDGISALERGVRRAPHKETLELLVAALDLDGEGRREFEAAAAQIRAVTAGRRAGSTHPQQTWLVPAAMRTHYFCGRERLLAQLRDQLAQRRRAALSGLGGVGKTQTALEYAVRHRSDYPGGVFWVNAESPSGLTAGFVDAAQALGLPAALDSQDEELGVRAALDWFNTTDRWLLILDNVEDRAAVLRFVPESDGGHVLITSRDAVFAEIGIPRGLEVRDLESDEAVRFLFSRTGRDESNGAEREAAVALAAELGHLPLALEQAAAYVGETNARFSAYLEAFRARRIELLEKRHGSMSHESIAVTWAANFAAVERISPAAAEALRISAFVDPDAIPYELFSRGAQQLGESIALAISDGSELAVAELLVPLARYSLLRYDAGAEAFGVHRLVLEIVRSAIAKPQRVMYAERAVAALDAIFPNGDYGDWPQCNRLVAHAASASAWVQAAGTPSECTVRLLNRVARYLFSRGRYGEATSLAHRGMTIANRTFGQDHLETAVMLNHLGVLQLYAGRASDAAILHERALAIRERALGPDHTDVAKSLNNLGNAYCLGGRPADAEPVFRRAYAIWERIGAAGSADASNPLNNLACAYIEVGRYHEAELLARRGLAIREETLTPGHPHVAESTINLAVAIFHLGRYADAEAIAQRSLSMREQSLGSDHLEVAESLNVVGQALSGQGRAAEAAPLHERAVAIYEAAVGKHHVWIAESLNALAEVRAKQGRYSDAETFYDRVLALTNFGLGPEHHQVVRSLTGLAFVRWKLGQPAHAEPYYRQALAMIERVAGPAHPRVARVLAEFALFRADRGYHADARALLERALIIGQGAYPPEHPELRDIRNRLAALQAAPSDIGAEIL